MNVIWIILAVLGLIGGQAYLFRCLKKLDKFLEKRPNSEPTFSDDDSCRYSEDVIE